MTHWLPYNAVARHRVLDGLASWAAAVGPERVAGARLVAPRPLHYALTGYWVLLFMWLKARALKASLSCLGERAGRCRCDWWHSIPCRAAVGAA